MQKRDETKTFDSVD